MVLGFFGRYDTQLRIISSPISLGSLALVYRAATGAAAAVAFLLLGRYSASARGPSQRHSRRCSPLLAAARRCSAHSCMALTNGLSPAPCHCHSPCLHPSPLCRRAGSLWISSLGRALFLITQKRVDEHRQWMVRNYCLTFAAVPFRVLPAAVHLVGVPPQTAYPIGAFLSVFMMVGVGEWYLARVAKPVPAAGGGEVDDDEGGAYIQMQ